jgi:hypothetical protein
MKLLKITLFLLPATLGIISTTFLCYNDKSWGYMLAASLLMFLVGIAAASHAEETTS